jgi:hypothetical protein
VSFVVVLLVAMSPPASLASPHETAQTDELVLRINRARVSAGLLPLARSTELDSAAQTHSADMVDNNYLDHVGADGSEPQQRAERAGYRVPPQSAWIVVEVISAISADPQGPVDWWLGETAQHSPVLLNPRWREIGAGYAKGGEFGNYWTALFGCRPGVLPVVALDGTTYTHSEQCGDPQEAATLGLTFAPASPTVIAARATPTASPTIPRPTVAATVTPPVSLAVSPASAAVGDSINIRWSGIVDPRSTDWIGLYRSGDSDAAFLNWTYIGCGTTPLDARTLGSCNIELPRSLSAGNYEFRLFRDNGYIRIQTSPAVPVR